MNSRRDIKPRSITQLSLLALGVILFMIMASHAIGEIEDARYTVGQHNEPLVFAGDEQVELQSVTQPSVVVALWEYQVSADTTNQSNPHGGHAKVKSSTQPKAKGHTELVQNFSKVNPKAQRANSDRAAKMSNVTFSGGFEPSTSKRSPRSL